MPMTSLTNNTNNIKNLKKIPSLFIAMPIRHGFYNETETLYSIHTVYTKFCKYWSTANIASNENLRNK